MTRKNTSSGLYELTDYPEFSTSSILSVVPKQEEKQFVPFNKYVLGLIVLFAPASISTDVNFDASTGFHNSSTLVYHNNVNAQQESDILHGFISNLLVNSEDLDGKIVDMVNENFWDLI
jgi:hypothetical protein